MLPWHSLASQLFQTKESVGDAIDISSTKKRGCKTNVRLPVKFPGCGQCVHACTVAIARAKAKKEIGLEKCMVCWAMMDMIKPSR